MSNEIIPGTSVGDWHLGSSKDAVIQQLKATAIEFTEVSPGGFDFINTSSLSLCFDAGQLLKQVCIIGTDAGAAFQGVGLGSPVSELAKLGHVVSVDIADRMLVIKDLPGIFFNFENDDEIDYEYAEEIMFEGDEGQLKEFLRPAEILQAAIDRICIANDHEVNPMFDLNP